MIAKEKWRRFFRRIGDEVFPDRYSCIVCDRELPAPVRDGTCDSCRAEWPYVGQAICLKCGKPILPEGSDTPIAVPYDPQGIWLDDEWEDIPLLVEVRDGTYCRLCRRYERHFDMARSAFAYCGIAQQSIYRMKFGSKGYIGRYLSAYVADAYVAEAWDVDMVAAVPLHWKRRLARGYNQAAIVARSFAERMQLPYCDDAIRKVRSTAEQAKLKHKERIDNLKGAFAADKSKVQGKRVLVVDDVLTTGFTLDEVAHALKKAGATRVYGLTVANVAER